MNPAEILVEYSFLTHWSRAGEPIRLAAECLIRDTDFTVCFGCLNSYEISLLFTLLCACMCVHVTSVFLHVCE